MALRVIGAGFGRTGTDSMREALTLLGFGPCHHMSEVIRDPEQRRLWRAVAQGAAPEWEHLFAGYAACVDFPSCFFWRELIEVYPEAKVLLTWRDAEGWWESYRATVGAKIASGSDPESVGAVLIAGRIFGGRPLDRDHVVAVYEAHVAEVIATVPGDRLLLHRLGDGWEPLCRHLGVPVPDLPYPRRNSTGEFLRDAAAPPASEQPHQHFYL